MNLVVFNIHNYINNIASSLKNKNEFIYLENEKDYDAIYFVLKGEVTLESNFDTLERKARTYHTGEFFGEFEFLNHIPRVYSARVTSDFAKIGILDREYFIRLSRNNPIFLHDLLMASLYRLSELNDLVQKSTQTIDLIFQQYIRKNSGDANG